MADLDIARECLCRVKRNDYVFGLGCIEQLGELVAPLGTRVAIVAAGLASPWARPVLARLATSLMHAGVEPTDRLIPGARPGAPAADVHRIAQALRAQRPQAVLAIGGGSTIDATKAAVVAAALGDQDESLAWLDARTLRQRLATAGARLTPLVAMQFASGSAAHLTDQLCLTDGDGRRVCLADPLVMPRRALFDYAVTATMGRRQTAAAGLAAVRCGLDTLACNQPARAGIGYDLAATAVGLVIGHLQAACDRPEDLPAREAIGLATDLAGCCRMLTGARAGVADSDFTDTPPARPLPPEARDHARRLADAFARAGCAPAAAASADLGEGLRAAAAAFARSILN